MERLTTTSATLVLNIVGAPRRSSYATFILDFPRMRVHALFFVRLFERGTILGTTLSANLRKQVIISVKANDPMDVWTTMARCQWRNVSKGCQEFIVDGDSLPVAVSPKDYKGAEFSSLEISSTLIVRYAAHLRSNKRRRFNGENPAKRGRKKGKEKGGKKGAPTTIR